MLSIVIAREWKRESHPSTDTLGSTGREIHKVSPGQRGRVCWGHGSTTCGAHLGPLGHCACMVGSWHSHWGVMCPHLAPLSREADPWHFLQRHLESLSKERETLYGHFFHEEDTGNNVASDVDEVGS